MDRAEIIKRVKALMVEFNAKQVDREELSKILTISLFSMKHVFLLGEPGVSKTGGLEIFATAVDSEQKFQITIKNNTKYEEIFGESYRDSSGRLVHDATYSISDAHFAILDECWKGDSKIMNSLLSIMSNSRTVDILGVGPVKSPLIMAAGASNELPIDKAVRPLRDRYLFSYVVEKIQGKENWIKFASRDYDRNPEITEKFSPDEIKNISKEAFRVVEVPSEIIELLYEIRQKVVLFEISVSERKFDNAIDVFMVSAYLNDRDRVDFGDLILLQHILWDTLVDREKIKDILHDILYGNVDSFILAFKKITKRFQEIQTFVDGHLKDFMKFRRVLVQEESQIFYQNIENLKSVVNEYDAVYVDTVGFIEKHNDIVKREKMVSDNIFLSSFENNIFGVVDIMEIVSLQKEITNKRNAIVQWLNECSDIAIYNLNAEQR